MSAYVDQKPRSAAPRVPMEGRLDLTHRCNNLCRHCWVRTSGNMGEKTRELSLDEIKSIVDQARSIGCRRWSLFGGEPLIRDDFTEIFDYITRNSIGYTLNTNGSMITPAIAQLLRRKGTKLVSLYGATGDVHDRVTRRPGSFEETLRGFSYLKEAGAKFVVQVVPMRANFHQYGEMISLAESLSPVWRIGASWLYLSACGDPERNKEIARQRLDPQQVVELDTPNVPEEDRQSKSRDCGQASGDDRLFAECIRNNNAFHIDPYGRMTFCSYIADEALRFDLRKGSLQECWDEFIPSLANRIRGGSQYAENCGSCDYKAECLSCAAYSYLEHRDYSAKVEYLCEVTKAYRSFRLNWNKNHRRYYQLAGVTIQVDADLPILDNTFHKKIRLFEVDGPGEDSIGITHHFHLPDKMDDLGEEIYRGYCWSIFKKGDCWIYRMPRIDDVEQVKKVAVFSSDYTNAIIYCRSDTMFRAGALEALTTFPTDQLVLAQVFAHRQACYFHSSGANIDGHGFLFVGHSEAGKSTVARLLDGHKEVLCDERIVVRKWPDGLWIHGSWSHGEVPIVSPNKAPLKAICFLNKADKNWLEPVKDRAVIVQRLLSCLVKPYETKEWWEETSAVIEHIAEQVPCYILHFNKNGEVVQVLADHAKSEENSRVVEC